MGYYLAEKLVRQSEKAVFVKMAGDGARGHWFPKSAVGLWETADEGLVLGVEGWFRLPVGAGAWVEFGESAAAVVEMKRTARPVNLYEHVQGYVPEVGV